MTRRATLFAHWKYAPAGGVHPIQPLLRGGVFPATPRANACLDPAFGSAKQRPPDRQPLRFGTRQKGGPPPWWPGDKGPAVREQDGAGASAPRTGHGPTTPRARDCTRPQAPRARDQTGSAPGDPVVGRPGVLVRGLILRDDRRGDAAALADLVATLLGPGPDFRTALTAGP